MEMMTKQVEMKRVARNVTNQFVLDEDYNVPDSKNDIEKIVLGEGTVKINEVNFIKKKSLMKLSKKYE